MDAKVAQMIVDAADFTELKLQSDYSGRSMYGVTTTAIVCDSITDFIAGVAAAAGDLEPHTEDEEIQEIVLACQSLRTDQMGLGIVVY